MTRQRRLLAGGLAAAMALTSMPQARAASLFEQMAHALFGAPAQPSARVEPLEMTVRPRPQRQRAAVQPTRPAPPAVKLDASDPYWHLQDPTLRKGDIVVTQHGVVVFTSAARARSHRLGDFVPLASSRALGKSERAWLELAAAGGRASFGEFADKHAAMRTSGPRISAAE